MKQWGRGLTKKLGEGHSGHHARSEGLLSLRNNGISRAPQNKKSVANIAERYCGRHCGNRIILHHVDDRMEPYGWIHLTILLGERRDVAHAHNVFITRGDCWLDFAFDICLFFSSFGCATRYDTLKHSSYSTIWEKQQKCYVCTWEKDTNSLSKETDARGATTIQRARMAWSLACALALRSWGTLLESELITRSSRRLRSDCPLCS